MQNIREIAQNLKLNDDQIFCYGDKFAKVNVKPRYEEKSRLVLVSSMTPSKSGIGKTTVAIGLADALNKQNLSSCLSLREPSLGPLFGIKGGATGGGKSRLLPSDEINLHFTGDMHAITVANNLLCSIVDNHIFQGNKLNINPEKIRVKRCQDINDRTLREQGYTLTPCSELMLIMSFSDNIEDLRRRLKDIIVAEDMDGNYVYARDLECIDAMCILLKDALLPNLVQTAEGTPALVHLGAFGNVAHGCSSNIATKVATTLAEYTITEAGFGLAMGGQKFFDLTCRTGSLTPNGVVVVASIPALRYHGGVPESEMFTKASPEAIKNGLQDLLNQCSTLHSTYHVPFVVAINVHENDTEEEYNIVKDCLEWVKYRYCFCDPFNGGWRECMDLACQVIQICEEPMYFNYSYEWKHSIEEKIERIVKCVYLSNKDVEYSDKAKEEIKKLTEKSLWEYPILMRKTPTSITDIPNDKLTNYELPASFVIHVTDVEVLNGAKVIAVTCGKPTPLMPALGKTPSYRNMKISDDGVIENLD